MTTPSATWHRGTLLPMRGSRQHGNDSMGRVKTGKKKVNMKVVRI